MSGYIKLHRGWRDNEVFHDEPYCERLAWAWLLENAAWKDCKRRVGKGHIASVMRGQIHVSLASLAGSWKWSLKRVRGFLERLEKCSMVGTIADTNGTLITICNYEKYQGEGHNQGTVKGTIRAQSGHTQEEGKERKERKKDIMGCPDGVDPTTWSDWVELRKTKRATVTEAIVEGIRKKAASIDWTLQMAMDEMLQRGWQGFDPSWVNPKQSDDPMANFIT